MTIRVSCSKCESVLKIRDEMAGTKAKCPKCKTPFVIPQLAAVAKVTPVAEELLEDLVDMPREVTPPVQFDTEDGFDPLAVLASGSQPAIPAVSTTPEAPKPSVAELMREHEAAQASKKKRRDKKNSSGLVEASGGAALMTAGTASDAITRTYDQKRGKTSEPAPMTREERRDAEQKEALKEFAVKGLAGLATIAIVGYFGMSWLLSESVPDLGYVTGVVTINGQPMPDLEVMFARSSGPGGAELGADGATTSTGFTNSSGEYTLMFNQENEGVLPGTHDVFIVSTAGISYSIPPPQNKRVVVEGETQTIDFGL